MIKKLRNEPYAPKSGASSQMGEKRKKKLLKGERERVNYNSFNLSNLQH
jgi:hypothetical protein